LCAQIAEDANRLAQNLHVNLQNADKISSTTCCLLPGKYGEDLVAQYCIDIFGSKTKKVIVLSKTKLEIGCQIMDDPPFSNWLSTSFERALSAAFQFT
jgi:hypothetical protein